MPRLLCTTQLLTLRQLLEEIDEELVIHVRADGALYLAHRDTPERAELLIHLSPATASSPAPGEPAAPGGLVELAAPAEAPA